MGRLIVDGLRVLLEDVVAAGPGGVLQLVDGGRVEEVELAFPAPLVLAPAVEIPVGQLARPGREGPLVPGEHLGGDLVETDTADAADRAGEVRIHHVGRQSDGLEHLGPGVGRHGRDAHLGHDLEHALAACLDVVADGLPGRHPGEDPVLDQIGDGVEGQIGVDGGGAVAEQERHVVHLAGLSRLDDETHAGPGLFLDQMVMDRADEEQGRDRRQLGRGMPVGKDDDFGPVRDGDVDLLAHLVERLAQGRPGLGPR